MMDEDKVRELLAEAEERRDRLQADFQRTQAQLQVLTAQLKMIQGALLATANQVQSYKVVLGEADPPNPRGPVPPTDEDGESED